MLFSLLDLALALYEDQTTFDTMEIAQYERYGETGMITLVLGGSGSGKSAYAEHLLDGKRINIISQPCRCTMRRAEKKLQDTGDFAREKDLLRWNSRGISGK